MVAVLLIIGSAITSFYVADVTKKNAQALQLRDSVTKSVNLIRQANQQADTSLSDMVIAPEKKHPQQITQALKKANDEINNLRQYSFSNTPEAKSTIEDLFTDTRELQNRISILIEQIKDPNWVYPMLPYINNFMLESNTAFETAATLALQEIAEEEGEEYASSLYRDVAQIRDLWRLQILNFRAVIVRFSGLNRVERIPQEKNIALINSEIQQKIEKLEKFQQQGKLGFETEEAVVIMRDSAKKWFLDFQKVQAIRDSQVWRADIYFIDNSIRPLQLDIREGLGQLEKIVLDWSSKNTAAVENAALNVNLELWGMTSAAVLFVIFVYLMISRTVLKPIEKIASIISEESKQINTVALPKKSSREIHALTTAYNAMQQQIQHRQIELEHQALHDPLTGLPNRALLHDRLEQTIQQAKRHKTSIALMLLDLDRFKDINDTLGHSVGDRVLQEISSRLGNCLRTSDTVARLGGDEFAIICPDIDASQASHFTEKVIDQINAPIVVEEQNLFVGVSIGITFFPDNGENPGSLLRQADIAMYDAKRNKKGYSFFHDDLDQLSSNNLSLLADLKEELQQPSGALFLRYQPQINLKTNTVYGAEALLRWHHPTNGMMPPETVIQMCEQSGLMTDLSLWVLENAIKTCKNWEENNSPSNISVNLSAWNIQTPELPQQIKTLLDQHNLIPGKLTLEITESAVMSDPSSARKILTQLSEMGIQLDIDDYGTGFSSLAYLKMLPVNGLKIDKSFVVDMEEDNNDKIIVHSTIDLAHNLNLAVIAEGVETKAAFESLRKHNCDYAQGHYIAYPMSETDFIEWCLDYEKFT